MYLKTYLQTSKVTFGNILQINLKIIKKSLKNDEPVIYYTNNKLVKNKQKYSKNIEKQLKN